MLKRLFILAILILGPIAASAEVLPSLLVGDRVVPFHGSYEVPLTEQDRAEIRGVVERLLDRALLSGVTEVGSLDVQNLKSRLREVKIRAVGNGALVAANGIDSVRVGAAHIVETKTVFVNQGRSNDNAAGENENELLVHEFLGALGIDDRSYQVSTLLLGGSINLPLIHKLKSDFPARLQSTPKTIKFYDQGGEGQLLNPGAARKSGGISVVGSGGDEVLADVKSKLVENLPLVRVIMHEYAKTGVINELEKIPNIDIHHLEKYDSSEVYDRFDLYLLTAPVELLTFKYGLVEKEISNISSASNSVLESDLRGAFAVAINSQSSPYVRISRYHWMNAIEGMNLEQSRKFLSLSVLLNLYLHWVGEVYEAGRGK